MENPFVIAAGCLLGLVLATVDNPMYAAIEVETAAATIESACQPYATAAADGAELGPLDLEVASSELSLASIDVLNAQ